MYHQYFGLNEAPFSIAVNPRYLFMSARHRDALAHLLYGVGSGGGFILLTGEVGTGKTTINRCLLEQLPDDTDIAIVLNPALNAQELLATVCDELGISYDRDSPGLKSLTDKLHEYLLQNHGRGRKTVLLIDEAQHLDFDVLEQIRLLTNLETHSEKLLQIVLIGQPELASLLQQPQLRQLNQRITARYNLQPLNLEETRAYIRHRLQVAGLAPGRELFPAAVVKGIYRRTRGIPRLINLLCDRMLLGAYGQNRDRVSRAMLEQAAREVMGEENARLASPVWRRPLALASLLILLGTAGWWSYRAQTGPAGEPVADTGAGSASQAVAAPEVQVAPVVQPVPAAPGRDWMLAPGDAWEALWRLSSDSLAPAPGCSEKPHAGLACVSEQADTWEELRALDRPLLLHLVTPERFAAAAILVDLTERDGTLMVPDGLLQVPLAELGALWRGRYQFLWHPPAGFDGPLAVGQRSPAVARVAALFAQLDGQDRPLAEQQFNRRLEQRVRMFQLSQGLVDDGVVGLQTLLKLNEALAIDTTRDVALSRLRADAAMVAR